MRALRGPRCKDGIAARLSRVGHAGYHGREARQHSLSEVSAVPFLGIDVGTGGTRALLLDSSGAVLASASAEHAPFASPRTGWAEQQPENWWSACQAAVRSLLRLPSVSAARIECVALAGQMHGAVLLDAEDRPVRPALIWCDQRTAPQCEALNRNPGRQRLVEWVANPALTNFTLTKLLWVREHEPENWARFRSFLMPKDYVRMRLTGVRATDMAEASGTLLLDVRHRRWSREMLAAVDLPASCLPDLAESPEIVGAISAEAAAATGLPAGIPVAAGAGDQAAGALGMGIVRPGDASATIGTSGVVFAATDAPIADPRGRLHTFCHAVPGRWHVMGVTQAAGLSLRWFRDTFGPTGANSYDELCREAAAAPPGAGGVLWAPYLMGERTPHLDPRARAALLGLAANHGRAEIIRAVLEGVAFSLKDTLTIFHELAVPVDAIRLGGGGARSALWRQIQADIYGQRVATVAVEEGAAHGAALLAGVAVGAWKSVDEACSAVVTIREQIEPEPTAQKLLAKTYERYRLIYHSLKIIF